MTSSRAIVRQEWGAVPPRWCFVLEDDEGTVVHQGEGHLTKLAAMRERDLMVRRAGEQEGSTDPVIRAARRAIYVTMDRE